jgi:hypothetical protein
VLQSVANSRSDLVGVLGGLDAAIQASPAAAVQDAQSISEAGHQQIAAIDTASDEAKAKAADFDNHANTLDQTATAFAKGLSCQG